MVGFAATLWVLGLIPLAVIVWVIAASRGRLAGGAGRALKRERAVCGACAYAVDATNLVRCPECGTHYAEGGIATRALAVRLSPPVWVVAVGLGYVWLGVLGVLLLVGTSLTRTVRGPAMDQTMTFSLGYRATSGPAVSGDPATERPNYTILLDGDLLESGRTGRTTGKAEIGLMIESTPVGRLEFDVSTRVWRLLDGTGAEVDAGDGVGAEQVDRLYEMTGVSGWRGEASEREDATRLVVELIDGGDDFVRDGGLQDFNDMEHGLRPTSSSWTAGGVNAPGASGPGLWQVAAIGTTLGVPVLGFILSLLWVLRGRAVWRRA